MRQVYYIGYFTLYIEKHVFVNFKTILFEMLKYLYINLITVLWCVTYRIMVYNKLKKISFTLFQFKFNLKMSYLFLIKMSLMSRFNEILIKFHGLFEMS